VAYRARVVLHERSQQAVDRVTEALIEQGFVVVTQLDLREVMQTKLGVAIPDEVVLGCAGHRRPLPHWVSNRRWGCCSPCRW
jgi:uncharacterized protein (DUF302 family)